MQDSCSKYRIMGSLIHCHTNVYYITLTKTPCLHSSLKSTNHHFPTTKFNLKMAATGSTTTAAASTSADQNPDQFSGIEQKKIIIRNNCGEKLVGLLHETGSKEIVIVCHGYQCTKENSMMTDLAFALEKQGISAFRFDFSGNGESEGSFQFANYHKEVDDLHEVVNHFHKANRVVSAIIGHSKGGDVVLLYASLHPEVKTIVNVSGRYRLDAGIEQRLGDNYLERAKRDGFIDVKSKTGEVVLRVTEENLMERLNTDMHEAALKIEKDCRVLTVHGSADDIIPVEDASEFDKIIKNHKVRIIEGADHLYKKHRTELVSAILPFIKDNIRSDSGK